MVREFWREFSGSVDEIKDLRVTEVLDALNEILGPHIFPAKEDGSDPRACPSCSAGRLSLKVGRFGAFVGCSNYPECRYTRQFNETGEGDAEAANPDGKLLGHDPETGLPVTLRKGRFGPYVQLGDADGDDKPRRSSIPRGIDAATLDLERALQLLSLPREVGIHPETGEPITAGLGRFGPFVLHNGTYANVESIEDVFTIGINRAVAVLAEKAAGGSKKWSRPKATVLKDLGEHPDGGGKIEVLSGRYGPYVKHGSVNATVPKGKEPATLTVPEAVELLAARAAQGGGKKKPARKPAKAKAPAKEPAAAKAKAKAPAKKAAAKPRAKAKPTQNAAE